MPQHASNEREVIRPSFNTPVIVRLSCDQPRITVNQFTKTTEFQYSLNANTAVMWVPSAAKAAIEASGAKQGDEIRIRKSETKPGNGIVTWEVTLVEEEPAPARPAAETRPQAAIRQQAQLAKHITQEPEPARPGAKLLAGCLYCAIDAAIAAEQYAQQKSLPLKLTSDDIRAMAISLYIDSRKEVR